ncbi:DUF1177 domain-containing protein [Kocuria sp. TGY1127_2]|uniref:DUF1177 domain-containing protein n=1 Tax=Kocuria sp. TGY1127_2 TaxID=2711328 RepID=UPI0015BBDA64|nr:DUF1177 domain-containing protein [Kocuria sp. TGY1127_2]
MSIKEVSEVINLIDSPSLSGAEAKKLLDSANAKGCTISVDSIPYDDPNLPFKCDFIKVVIPGNNGKTHGGKQRTLGIIGRLGAQQAQPERIGMVSDSDGSIVALALALKLLRMHEAGAILQGDVIITTHVATHVSIKEHKPVDFMGSPISSAKMNDHEVDKTMDAILSVDTSKGNKIINHRGIAISATAKQGYILPVAPDLVSILENATGEPAFTFPVSLQDITPYENGFYHFNSIMQPHVATVAPVIGLALTAKAAVPGSVTGASYPDAILDAVRFGLETAVQFTWGRAEFYDSSEFENLQTQYGSLKQFQTSGKK